MALSIKRRILARLSRFGFNFELSHLKVHRPSSSNNNKANAVGQTYVVDLPPASSADTIFSTFKKIIGVEPTFIESVVPYHDEQNSGQCEQALIKVNFDFVAQSVLRDLQRGNLMESIIAEKALDHEKTQQTVIVEFSSPNIAKPFHVGNFRSTIIGNSVSKLLEIGGDKVIRMNYLGDWGTQFGILSLAYELYGDGEKLGSSPLKHLFDVYVKGNQEIKNNPEMKEAAKARFKLLETKQNPELFEQWAQFREMSVKELIHLYSRLGIVFDYYTSESMYSESAFELVKKINEIGLLERCQTGAFYVKTGDENQVPLLKSDGSTLYITRDLAAVFHRKEKFNFDRMYYVVDSSQSKHFTNLQNILRLTNRSSIHSDIRHLKFGRIIGMSTRKGEVIFLDDVLNQAKQLALEAIRSSSNTKIDESEYERVADILGVSALIVHDLSNRRVREYQFDWDKALKLNGNTGISLQYTHARLSNLRKNCGIELDTDRTERAARVDVRSIDNDSGRQLVNLLCMFEEVIDLAHQQLEPSIVLHYLFELKRAINRANQDLTIKGTADNVAHTRLLLFNSAQNVFHLCMRLLGLEPLASM